MQRRHGSKFIYWHNPNLISIQCECPTKKEKNALLNCYTFQIIISYHVSISRNYVKMSDIYKCRMPCHAETSFHHN